MMQLWSKELLGSVAALKIYGLTLTYQASNGGGSSSTSVFYSASRLKPNITQDVYTWYDQITNISGNIGSAGSTITTAGSNIGNFFFNSATTDLWGRPAFLYVTNAGWFNSAIIVSPKQKNRRSGVWLRNIFTK